MKKYFLSIVALAAMLLATSCQESMIDPQIEGTTTFTVQLPDQMGTKAAIGSKENVNRLHVQVYPADIANASTYIVEKVVEISGGSAEVELNLIQDQVYNIIFWAQNENASYNVGNLRSIEMVNHHNSELGAAFYAYVPGFTPNGGSNAVTLRRPFAQLNLGTTSESLMTDLDATNPIQLEQSAIVVSNVAASFNTVAGCGEGTTTRTFALADVPNEKLTVSGKEYVYISMDYLAIVGEEQALVTVDATITTDKGNVDHHFTNVPVKENHRTNIVGNLISSTSEFVVDINDDWAGEDYGVANDAEAAQALLDNAVSGTTIQLVPGVNYGTLKFRANPGHSNTTQEDIADAWKYNYNRQIENITIIGAVGAKVDGFVFETGALPGDCNNRVTVKNLVIDGVEFTDAFTASAAGYNAPIMITTSSASVDSLTVKNCNLEGNNSKLNLVYLYAADGSKNVTLTGNTVGGIARLCELRGTENVTITNNVINNTYEHAMLLAGGNYAGKVTITGNTADGIRDRFVRMAGAENATVEIMDNTIVNYRGADADYIKVTDSNNQVITNNVTIENNTLTSRTVPAGNTSDVVLNDKGVEVTIPAIATQGGDKYKIDVKNESTSESTETGEITVSFELELYKNGNAVNTNDVIYEVTKNIGTGKYISEVTHNGTPLTEATTPADQTYTYDSTTGVLTIYTTSFSPFEISYYNEAVAKVGNKEYGSIDDAIAAWTNNTTLTLLADVTLSKPIEISSTEYRELDLGIYTMTAAKSKDAIQIINNGRKNASYALDIKADATNPGGIIAKGKAVVKTTGKSGVQDRPIIRFYNGVFTATNIVYHSGSNGTNCPQFYFYNGVYNGTFYADRALFQFHGGTFNGSLHISVDSSAYALISGGKFKYLNNSYGSALNSKKFTIGSAKGVFDRGVYVDDEGYFVVGGPVITEFGEKFVVKAKAEKVSKAGTYLPYSSAATYGLYFTNEEIAKTKYTNPDDLTYKNE